MSSFIKMESFMNLMTSITERGLMPDSLTRHGIRSLLAQRLGSLPEDSRARNGYLAEFVAAMGESPVAECTREANEQHYEVPAAYFDLVLGKHKKYSSCYWDKDTLTLDQAEANALHITCERAGIANGQRILELGCGWGSLTLWMAEHYPGARITAVSNSSSQRQWIEHQLRLRNLPNVQVITADMNSFDGHRLDGSSFEKHGGYDRVVSVEMFEHMRNWRELFSRVSHWLADDGQFFMHVFCHKESPYFFQQGEDNDWMSRHFFSGGMMPCFSLPEFFQEHLTFRQQWRWNGEHYARTLKAWLDRHDAHREEILGIFSSTYGADARLWFVRWRLFYLACEELFRYNGGNEWFVGHYLFSNKSLFSNKGLFSSNSTFSNQAAGSANG